MSSAAALAARAPGPRFRTQHVAQPVRLATEPQPRKVDSAASTREVGGAGTTMAATLTPSTQSVQTRSGPSSCSRGSGRRVPAAGPAPSDGAGPSHFAIARPVAVEQFERSSLTEPATATRSRATDNPRSCDAWPAGNARLLVERAKALPAYGSCGSVARSSAAHEHISARSRNEDFGGPRASGLVPNFDLTRREA